jgi:hypothetical protein
LRLRNLIIGGVGGGGGIRFTVEKRANGKKRLKYRLCDFKKKST